MDAGTYYIAARSFYSLANGPYRPLLRKVAEPGSSRAAAAALAVGGFGGGNIDLASDTDYFRIEVEDAALMAFSASSQTAGLSGALLDDNGDSLGEAIRATQRPGDIITLTINRTLAPGTYYLRVDTRGRNTDDGQAATGPYAVSASEEPYYRALLARLMSSVRRRGGGLRAGRCGSRRRGCWR